MLERVENKVKKYAIKKFVKSDYLKQTTNLLHLTILTFLTKSIFNFLITSRIRFNIYLLDMIFSIIITIIFSLYSPFFYNLIEYIFKNEIDSLSQYVISNFWEEGWAFFEYWKVRILGTLGLLCIFILFFIEINSQMIQEFILHTMISSAVVDYIYKQKDNVDKIEKKENKEQEQEQEQEILKRVISTPNMMESYFPDFSDKKENNELSYSFLEDYKNKLD
jgi:hypothetical protein